MEQKDTLKEFLAAWEAQHGSSSQKAPTEPVPTKSAPSESAPSDGGEGSIPSPAPSSEGADTKKPSPAVGAPTAGEKAKPTKIAEEPAGAEETEEPEEAEEEVEEIFPSLNPDDLLEDIDEMQFLTSPKAVLSEIVKRVDSHYRQSLNQTLTQVSNALAELAERQLQWELEQLFYRQNPDLVGHEKVLTEVLSVLTKDPRWLQLTIPQRMEVLARAARERLTKGGGEEAPPTAVVRGTPPPPADEQKQKVKQFIAALEGRH